MCWKPKCLLGSQLEKCSPGIKDVIRCVPGLLLLLWFSQHLQKVPCADKCLINKIKKRFGCRLNPSPGFFSYWISRLIIFSGQTSIPPVPPFIICGSEKALVFFSQDEVGAKSVSFTCSSVTLTITILFISRPLLMSFLLFVHSLLQDRNASHCI